MYTNNKGHMTKMVTMPIYGKNPSKIFCETNRLISRRLGVKHRRLKYSNVYINHDPVMTLTKFMARSTWVAYAFEWGKLLKMSFEGKSQQEIGNEQNIDYSEKRKWTKGFICPCTGVKYYNIRYMQQISGERLQDHWSSGISFLFMLTHMRTTIKSRMTYFFHFVKKLFAHLIYIVYIQAFVKPLPSELKYNS